MKNSIAVTLLLFASIQALAGNGLDRGGGDFNAQQFTSIGQEIAVSLIEWRKRDPRAGEAIDLPALQKALQDVIVVSKPSREMLLKRKGKWDTVDAINDPKAGRIEINRDTMKELWIKSKDDQITFVLHEYCRFLGLQDHHYEITGRFLARLHNEKALEGFRKELSDRLSAIIKAHEQNFVAQKLDAEAILRPVELSSDYRVCNDPKSSHAQLEESCMTVARMIENSVSGFSLGFKKGALSDFGTNLRIQEFEQLESSLPQNSMRRALVSRLGDQVVNRLQEITQNVKNKTSDYKAQVKSQCTGSDLAVACTVKKTRALLSVQLPNLLTQAEQASESILPQVAAELDHYYEAEPESR